MIPDTWTDDALCAQTDPELFFPEKGSSSQLAKTICAQCPVAKQCLEYALANREYYGVWGGTNHQDRARMGYSGRPSRSAFYDPRRRITA